MRGVLLLLGLVLGTGALADELERSPRPPFNPRLAGVAALPASEPGDLAPAPVEAPVEAAAATASALPESVLTTSLRPAPRPRVLVERLSALRSTSNAPGLDLSGREPRNDIDLAAIPPPSKKEERRKKREQASMQGAVCGVPAIKGEEIAQIKSGVGGCGVDEPVRVSSVSGVRLSQAATVDCSIAKALNSWVAEVAQPTFDGKLVELQIAAHYICRSRNNVKGAKVSEHGRGRAVDISAFILANGKVLTVAQNYDKLLRRIYKAGCSYFKTTLGPGSDGYHEDHFHFDTSTRKGGAYCR